MKTFGGNQRISQLEPPQAFLAIGGRGTHISIHNDSDTYWVKKYWNLIEYWVIHLLINAILFHPITDRPFFSSLCETLPLVDIGFDERNEYMTSKELISSQRQKCDPML